MDLPSGTVALLLTDIEGSTRLADRARSRFDEALDAHHRLLREAFRRHGGHEAKELGDGFVVVFDRATDALACAVASQQALQEHSWPGAVGRLPVRIALHAGEVELKGGEYRGQVLHHASRLLAAGHGGQIICSEAVAILLRPALESGFRLTDLGVYRLRDVSTPQRVFQVDRLGLPQQGFPPLRAEACYGSQLPLTLTRFFGRAADLAWLREVLLQSDTRLVTLTGPGGSGKTRLALEAARQLVEPLHGAVCFAPLQSLSHAGLIPGAVLDALRVPRLAQVAPLDQAAEALARQPALVVLDNFEHLIEDGTPIVRTLLEGVASLTCLVTSRQTLNLAGETEYSVGPLSTPSPEHEPRALMRCESVQLFVDRAQAARPDFQVTRANAKAMAELCARLEGLPLAIELAAARAQVLTPAQMLAQMERRFEFLVSRKRDVPDRHRTLWAALDWSYQALSAELQRFFRRLSAFRGGWNARAAEIVCDEPRALEYLEQLRECSLVLLSEGAEEAGELRCQLLEALREYGAEQIGPEERQALRQRHAECYLALAEEARTELEGPEQVEWLERLQREHDNLRAALEWLSVTGSTERQLRLAGALGAFWQTRGHLSEGRKHLAEALGREQRAASPALRARALQAAGQLASAQGDHLVAGELLEQSLAMWRELDDGAGIGRCLSDLGCLAHARADYPTANTLLGEALTVFRELGDHRGTAACLDNLGFVAHDQGNYATAAAFYEQALAIVRDIGDNRGIAFALVDLGDTAAHRGDHAKASRLFQEALAICRELGEKRGAAACLYGLSCVAQEQGDHTRGGVLAREALAAWEEIGDKQGVAHALLGLASAARGQGDLALAEAAIGRGLAVQRELGDRLGVAASFEALAGCWAARGEGERAAYLFGAAEALREAIGAPLPPSDRAVHGRDVAATQAVLDPPAFAAAWAQGRALTWELAVAYALSKDTAGPASRLDRR